MEQTPTFNRELTIDEMKVLTILSIIDAHEAVHDARLNATITKKVELIFLIEALFKLFCSDFNTLDELKSTLRIILLDL